MTRCYCQVPMRMAGGGPDTESCFAIFIADMFKGTPIKKAETRNRVCKDNHDYKN